jgi:acetate---CoA ligase (ADP-forming)
MPMLQSSLYPPLAGKVTLRQALLAPRSVAIVGQSNDASKTAGRPLQYLRQAGFAGRIYPVNARRPEVLGERAWASLTALPEVPEHAYIVLPTDAAIEAAEECGRLGVAVATVLANGFSEAGAEGVAREARLRDIVARTGIRIVGPSSLGVVDLRHKLFLTANAAFAETDFPVGRTFVASHSGSMIGAIASRAKARGIGFAGLASVGNEADLSVGEICAAVLDDPGIDGFVLFLETMRKAEQLYSFAQQAAARDKAVVAYKLGRSDVARELAVSHTGALAGEDDVADEFLKSCGIARVETLDGLIEGFPLAARIPIARGERVSGVGVVTTTAGGATMVVDPLASRGVHIATPSPETLAQLRQRTGIEVAAAHMIDLTVAGTRYEAMKAALDVMMAAPEFDLVLAVVGSSARFHPDLAVQPIVDSAQSLKPITAFMVPDAPEALARLAAAGVPSFRTPEACADAIAAAFGRRLPKSGARAFARPGGHGRMLDEAEGGKILDRLGIERAPCVIIDADVIKAPALPFAYPVAVKILSAEISHKSIVGGVVLDVKDGPGVIAAIQKIKHATKATRVLIQPMMAGVGEALVGYRVDPDVGPLVMLAAGGVMTEVYRDRSLRLAPVELAEARDMIAEVKLLTVLSGQRGRPAGDLDALTQAIVALSQLADDPSVTEAEINPLIVRAAGEGVIAVDALVELAGKA